MVCILQDEVKFLSLAFPSSPDQDLHFLKCTVSLLVLEIIQITHGKDGYNGNTVGDQYVFVESNHTLFSPLVNLKQQNKNEDIDKHSYRDCLK